MRTPEKTLSCGHALCDVCIRLFGSRVGSEKNSFCLSHCVLCGETNSPPVFQLTPPTAGIRLLAVDGGGVKGVLPLVFLQHIESQLADLGSSVRDYFDLVCGTSSGKAFIACCERFGDSLICTGGLIVLGIFLMQWSPMECLQKFEDFASSVFQRRLPGSSFFQRLQELFVAYLADCRYKSEHIEDALHCTFGGNMSLFNPLRNDTKVAVTTTTAKESLPCLFTNYNGGRRPKSLGYSLIRAEEPDTDVLVRDA